MVDLAQARRTMIDCQVRTFDVTDLGLLQVMDQTPREKFVPPAQLPLAYSDQLIHCGGRRWLLTPMAVARLLQALRIRAGEAVLDVGCGGGYTTALAAKLGGRVTGLESDPTLAALAKAGLAELGLGATVVTGPVAEGYPQGGPFDAIIVNGAFQVAPDKLLEQLAPEGRLAGIDAGGSAPQAVLVRRAGKGFSRTALFDCAAPVFDGLRRAPTFAF